MTVFKRITYKADIRQFFIDELLWICLLLLFFTLALLDTRAINHILFFFSMMLLLKVFYKYLSLMSRRYTLTDEQLISCYGVFARERNYMELYKIIDFQERRTFLQLLSGLKTITIISGDRTSRKIVIRGIRSKENIVQELRQRVMYNRQRMNIYELANYR